MVSALTWRSEGPRFDLVLGRIFSDRPSPGLTQTLKKGLSGGFPWRTKAARSGASYVPHRRKKKKKKRLRYLTEITKQIYWEKHWKYKEINSVISAIVLMIYVNLLY